LPDSYIRHIPGRIKHLDEWPMAEVEQAWRRLAESRGNAFVTPEWARAWLDHYGEDAQPALVTAHDEAGELIGVLPLARQGGGLRFAGANLGDCFEPAAPPEHEEAVAAAALPAGWRTLVLDNVEVGAPWARALRDAQPRRVAATRVRQASLPRASLPATFDDFLAARSRNFRSQVRRKTKALQEQHGATFRRTERPEQLARDLDAFFRLHHARWDERGGSSSRGERVRAFHGSFAAAALERGWLRLWLLEVEGQAVAAWYGWRLGRVYSYYQAGFDPEWADASVGLVLLAHTVRAAIEEGAEVYDMLLGDEPYKGRFADSERQVETLVITPALHPRRLAVALEAGARRATGRLSPAARSRFRRAAGVLVDRLPTGRER
jgi:CelD/BcsL family acetyltransferase involved in cellulose biosynthesis